ncbi:MAG: hypothetical protein J6R40_03295, partial [Clostridia bacterium]|nr:hypothetical protein [Clostridia bacterium]
TDESVYTMLGNVSRTLRKEGYQSGKMYEYENGDGVQTRAMVFSISAREYREYLHGGSDGGMFTDLVENAQSCTVTATTRPDGGYTVNFSDFLQSAIDELLLKMALSDTAASVAFENLILKAEISPSYKFEEISMTADVFSAGTKRQFSVASQYKDIGSTTVDDVDFTGYTEVHDLRIPALYAAALSERRLADEGHFISTFYEEISSSGQKTIAEETRETTYAFKDGKFTFDMDIAMGEEKYEVKYANGVETVYWINGTFAETISSQRYTDAEEIAYIGALIDYAEFSIYDVKDVKEGKTRDSYVLVLAIHDTLKESCKPGENYTYEDGTVEITVHFENGELASYEYALKMIYKAALTVTYTYTQTVTVAFVD